MIECILSVGLYFLMRKDLAVSIDGGIFLFGLWITCG